MRAWLTLFFLRLAAGQEQAQLQAQQQGEQGQQRAVPSCPLKGGGYDDRFAVAQVLIAQRNIEQAEACLSDALGATLGAYSLLSDIAAAQRQGDRAVALTAILEALNPQDGETVFLHAQRLGQVGRWREALPRLETLSASNPANGNVINTYGVALFNTDNFTAAESQFHKALTLAPNNTDYKANLDAARVALKTLLPSSAQPDAPAS